MDDLINELKRTNQLLSALLRLHVAAEQYKRLDSYETDLSEAINNAESVLEG
jgi:hypothetical protein